MKITAIPVGKLKSNCYIIETKNKNAIVIDPGADPELINAEIKKRGLTVKYIMFTHGHVDHISAAPYINGKLCIHGSDADMLLNKDKCLGMVAFSKKEFIPLKADIILKDGDEITLDEVTVKVMHTPGHTPGSCCFVAGDIMFSGDTLFCGAVGATHFPGGDFNILMQSISKLFSLKKDYTLLCGHGNQTTLFAERRQML